MPSAASLCSPTLDALGSTARQLPVRILDAQQGCHQDLTAFSMLESVARRIWRQCVH